MTLPPFRFYPTAYDQVPGRPAAFDPYDGECPLCDRVTGWAFIYPLMTDEEEEGVCPFCIADGGAAEAQDQPLNLIEDCVDRSLREELQLRTPTLASIQMYQWPTAAGTPMIYLGVKSFNDVRSDAAVWSAVPAAGDQWGTPEEREESIRYALGPACCWLHIFQSRDGAVFRAIIDGS